MTRYKALVVDDESHITHVVSLKLRNAGFEVLTASDGEEAFDLACAHSPHIIITDLQMPYMTGLELCERLRQNKATEGIPAILLTARGHALAASDLARTNIREVLSKPFSPREVLAKAERLLGAPASEPDSETKAA